MPKYTVEPKTDGSFAIRDNSHLLYSGKLGSYLCYTGIETRERADEIAANLNQNHEAKLFSIEGEEND